LPEPSEAAGTQNPTAVAAPKASTADQRSRPNFVAAVLMRWYLFCALAGKQTNISGKAKEPMAKTTTSANGFFDVSKVLGDFRFPGLGLQALADAQRKNLEALTQANQLAIEGMRALMQRQSEIVQEAAEEASAVLRDWTQPGAPEDRMAKSIEAAKLTFEKRVANIRELNDLGSKASADMIGVIARRISEGFDEVRLYAKKQAVPAE
jgi:phasin family protein